MFLYDIFQRWLKFCLGFYSTQVDQNLAIICPQWLEPGHGALDVKEIRVARAKPTSTSALLQKCILIYIYIYIIYLYIYYISIYIYICIYIYISIYIYIYIYISIYISMIYLWYMIWFDIYIYTYIYTCIEIPWNQWKVRRLRHSQKG